MTATSTISSAAAVVVDKLKMEAHPQVSSTALIGIITDFLLKVVKVKYPDWAPLFEGSEGQVAVIVGAIGGYLTRGRT